MRADASSVGPRGARISGADAIYYKLVRSNQRECELMARTRGPRTRIYHELGRLNTSWCARFKGVDGAGEPVANTSQCELLRERMRANASKRELMRADARSQGGPRGKGARSWCELAHAYPS